MLVFWREGLITILALAIFSMTLHIKSLNVDIKECKLDKELQSKTIEANRADVEVKLKELPEEKVRIETKYKTIYKNIESIKESNATCDNILSDLNNSNF